ncbi:trafficking kinesin-binding protein 2-like [Sebastes umbrosus]|uniref:trafficking kinesin-binding protein 2-like n=1 Tax=Sebastes umbrosus TaxID=72105 RepID=UPI00189EFBD8|nr:trafficking kinesin-binding protein 2-like [Sebastes umbrosus]
MHINGHLISTSTTNLALEKEELRIHLQASKEAQRRLTREVGNTLMDEAVHFLRHYHIQYSTQESNDDDELNAERNLDENTGEQRGGSSEAASKTRWMLDELTRLFNEQKDWNGLEETRSRANIW